MSDGVPARVKTKWHDTRVVVGCVSARRGWEGGRVRVRYCPSGRGDAGWKLAE
jgi:hypothetical protein